MPQQPGQFPYRRGLHPQPHPTRPWTIRQYAGFSTARATNQFYRKNLQAGQTGLSVAFDLPTHLGFDSDDPRALGDVGKAGVAICSVEDMKLLFEDIGLDNISVSMTMNGAVLPILAAYIVCAREQGVPAEKLAGTIQNDILKEFLVRNTYIYPPRHSLRVVADIIHHTTATMPLFNPISISGYHLGEAGATPLQELAFTLSNGIEYVKAALQTGLTVDDFAPRLSFFFGIGMDFFQEVAKLRAARELWAHIMRDRFGAQNEKSWRLRVHCQTSGVSLARQDPYNNLVRTTVEAMAAIFGGTQSLHTNSFDEAIALPSPFSARLARNTQLILQKETGITAAADPLGGSYYVEQLTDNMISDAQTLMTHIDQLGGMVAALNQGVPQKMVEEEAIKKQARFDSVETSIIGVNDYRLTEEEPIEILQIASSAVLAEQQDRLTALKKRRDAAQVTATLTALENIAADDKAKPGSLLAATIDAMAARATVGEVSARLTKTWGRHQATTSITRGIYSSAVKNPTALVDIKKQVASYQQQQGRAPRVLVSKLGLDGHDRGAKLISACLADAGFDVILAPLFLSPAEVGALAIKHNVNLVGISTHTAGHNQLLPPLVDYLKNHQRPNRAPPPCVVGGIIPDQDKPGLLAVGVRHIFDPGTSLDDILKKCLQLVQGDGALMGHNLPPRNDSDKMIDKTNNKAIPPVVKQKIFKK